MLELDNEEHFKMVRQRCIKPLIAHQNPQLTHLFVLFIEIVVSFSNLLQGNEGRIY